MSTEDDVDEKPRFGVRQEPDRLDRRGIAVGGLLAAVGLAISIGVTTLFVRASDREPLPPLPRTAPAGANTVETSLILGTERGRALHATQRATLDHYGWVDRDAGIVRIPIERAMDIVGRGASSGELGK